MIPKVTRLTACVSATMLLFLLHKRPLLVELDRSWPQVLDLLIVEALRMATTGFEQPSHRFLRHFSQSRSGADTAPFVKRSEEHTSELQSQSNLVCRLLLEKKKKKKKKNKKKKKKLQ